MANVVKLYYTGSGGQSEWELIPNKLLIIQDIEGYLATKSALTINDFQYQKNELELGINIDISQSYSQPKTFLNFKYVSIQNNGEQIHYYFVKKAVWRSKTCVRFELVMDVLNTFKEGLDYEWKENTKITREHKNRIIFNGVDINFVASTIVAAAGTINTNDEVSLISPATPSSAVFTGYFVGASGTSFQLHFNYLQQLTAVQNWLAYCLAQSQPVILQKDSNNYVVMVSATASWTTPKFYRNIDYISETIIPTLVHDGSTKIEKTPSIVNQNWYLLYRNQEEPSESLVNPVECYLIPEEETFVDSGVIVSGRLTASSLVYGKFYYARLYEKNLLEQVLIRQSITLPNGDTIDSYSYSYVGTYIEITRNRNNTLNVVVITYDNSIPGTSTKIQRTYFDIDYVQLNTLPFKYVELNNRKTDNFWLSSIWNNEQEWTDSLASNRLYPITQLDKTDAKNIKLIKLPYCPYDFTINSGVISVGSDNNWDYTYFEQASGSDFYALKLHDLNVKLTSNITQTNSPLKNLKVNFPLNAALTDLKTKYYGEETESKLFHSDFYRPTYVYDSFQFNFQLEKLYVPSYYDEDLSLTIKFDMTKTINSKFMFTFEELYTKVAEQNFYKVLPVARNNEEVLYNVPYINYIRTGFNYDVKAKNVANASNAIGLGLSMASVGAALLAPSVPLKIAGVVAALASTAMSIKNTVVSAINNENSIKQKITSTQNQATSVAGSDDVDLMSVYAENRLQYMEYTPNEMIKGLLKDLFFYAGYASGRMGKPTHNNRVNFDYLECEASIEKISSIPDECLTELINCFKAGVVYLHKTTRETDKWDFEQKYENWERVLFK